jgi:hypothetical protein
LGAYEKKTISDEVVFIQKKSRLNSEKILKLWKKSRLNSEMIGKIWKKNKSNSEMIWKKGKLNREKILEIHGFFKPQRLKCNVTCFSST